MGKFQNILGKIDNFSNYIFYEVLNIIMIMRSSCENMTICFAFSPPQILALKLCSSSWCHSIDIHLNVSTKLLFSLFLNLLFIRFRQLKLLSHVVVGHWINPINETQAPKRWGVVKHLVRVGSLAARNDTTRLRGNQMKQKELGQSFRWNGEVLLWWSDHHQVLNGTTKHLDGCFHQWLPLVGRRCKYV